MSAREDQPATVPPPAGEDDAYSAATKVGAMPAEVMAKLRAEGLLPEEDAAPPSLPPTSAKPAPRPPIPRPVPSGRPSPLPNVNASEDEPAVDSNLPVFQSVPPPVSGATGLPRANSSDPPEALEEPAVVSAPPPPSAPTVSPELVVDMGTPPTFPQAVETPVAFSAPPAPADMAPLSAPPSLQPPASRPSSQPGSSRGRLLAIVVLVCAVLVLFAVAFIRQRR